MRGWRKTLRIVNVRNSASNNGREEEMGSLALNESSPNLTACFFPLLLNPNENYLMLIHIQRNPLFLFAKRNSRDADDAVSA